MKHTIGFVLWKNVYNYIHDAKIVYVISLVLLECLTGSSLPTTLRPLVQVREVSESDNEALRIIS